MISIISKRITDRLLRREVIPQEDYEIYLFGVHQLIVTILDFLTCVVVGIIFGDLVQTLLFVVAFAAIRSYAGGYHASTQLRCYLLTTVMVIISVVMFEYMKCNAFVLGVLLALANVVILALAPVDTENKPMDAVEQVYFRRRAKQMLLIETVLALVSIVLDFEIGAEGIVWALVVLALALICEKVKKKCKNR